MCTGNRTEGSNPSLSAKEGQRAAALFFCNRRRERSSRPSEVNSPGPHPQVLGPQPPQPQNACRDSSPPLLRACSLPHNGDHRLR